MSAVPMLSRALGALSGILLAVVAAAPAATAVTVQDTTTCTGVLEHTRIDGTLVVEPGDTCTLHHVVVKRGDLVVLGGASVTLRSSEVQGATVVDGGTLVADAATFRNVRLLDAEVVTVGRATVRGSVGGTVRTFELDRVLVTGDIAVLPGDTAVGNEATVRLWSTTVNGSIATDGFQFQTTDLTVGADVQVTNATLPSHHVLAVEVCGVDVAGELRVEQSHWIVSMGAHPYGDPIACDPAAHPSTVGALAFLDNPHSIAVAGTTVAGDLVCTGNTGPRGVQTAGVVVGGARVGQCA